MQECAFSWHLAVKNRTKKGIAGLKGGKQAMNDQSVRGKQRAGSDNDRFDQPQLLRPTMAPTVQISDFAIRSADLSAQFCAAKGNWPAALGGFAFFKTNNRSKADRKQYQ